jgi:glycosyltransferase involved in cell wall biosynthesis
LLVSFIVPAFSCEATLPECLKRIKAQKCDKEIIVVIDGQNPSLSRICESSGVKHLTIPHSGASVARNVGFRLSKGDIVAPIDSDMMINGRWIKDMLGFDFSKWDVVTCEGFNTFIPASDVPERYKDPYITFSNQIVLGGGLVFPARMKGAYSYDEDFIVGGEDVAILYKLLNSGARIRIALKARFNHVHKAKDQVQRVVQYARRRVYFAYGEILVYLKFRRKGDFSRRVRQNAWVIPLVPFLFTYVKLSRWLARPGIRLAMAKFREKYG